MKFVAQQHVLQALVPTPQRAQAGFAVSLAAEEAAQPRDATHEITHRPAALLARADAAWHDLDLQGRRHLLGGGVPLPVQSVAQLQDPHRHQPRDRQTGPQTLGGLETPVFSARWYNSTNQRQQYQSRRSRSSSRVVVGSEHNNTHSNGSTPLGGSGSQTRITQAAITGCDQRAGVPLGAGTHTGAPANWTVAVRSCRPPRPGIGTVSDPCPGRLRAYSSRYADSFCSGVVNTVRTCDKRHRKC